MFLVAIPCSTVSLPPPHSCLLPLHTRTRIIAFSWFSNSHYFSLPIDPAHRHQISLKTCSGFVWLARLNLVQIFWRSNFCIYEFSLPSFELWHLNRNCLLVARAYLCQSPDSLGTPLSLTQSSLSPTNNYRILPCVMCRHIFGPDFLEKKTFGLIF